MTRTAFTIDTNLKTTRSILTGAFIDSYLSRKRDGRLAGIGAAVLTAAEEYGINASYIAAHAALETGWGTSSLARTKHNLFGWTAFDASPGKSARAFPSREACIDYVMGKVNALYLTPGGRYYRKAPCLGRGEPNSFGMNANYATDPDWGKKVARIANCMERAFLAPSFGKMASPRIRMIE